MVGSPDASAERRAAARRTSSAGRRDVNLASELARVGILGDGLQELVIALADRAAVVGGGEVDEADPVQLVEVRDGLGA